MKILALESSARAASCAVVADGAPIASAFQATGLTQYPGQPLTLGSADQGGVSQ